MADFVMPKLGADMAAGTLVTWRKQPGDVVRRGDIDAEVETDKGVIDVEIFTSGVIETLLVQPGEKVPVGTPLALIRGEGEAPVPAGRRARTTGYCHGSRRLHVGRSGRGAATVASPWPTPDLPLGTEDRRRAGSRSDLGTGHRPRRCDRARGRRTRCRRAEGRGAAAHSAQSRSERQARMRQAIAAAMSRSKREIPHYYLATTIDMHRAMTWLAEENRKRSVEDRLLYGILLLKAVALALREVPELNALWVGDQAVQSQAIHVGVAISLRQGGLVAPAIHDTDRQSLDELMRSCTRPGQPGARRCPPQFGVLRPDDHGHQSRGARRGNHVRHHLSAAGSDRGVRQGGRAALVGGRTDRFTRSGERHAVGRSSCH